MVQQDFRSTLRNELAERCRRNPRYSLRAFARDLGIEPARLSDVLNEKKGFSKTLALRLASRLGFSEKETERFVESVESLHARSKTARRIATERLASLGSDGETSLN